jgi:V/A-type H+-transporting ATPase subunit E
MGELHSVSSGVQTLIDRIRDEGVQAGRQEADRLVQEAQRRAADIVTQARAEADGLREKARAEIEAERTVAREALQLASRDTMLAFGAELTRRFSNVVESLVRVQLKDQEFLKQLILAIASRSAPDDASNRALELLLSDEMFPEGERQSLRDFTLALGGEVMYRGIELKPAGENKPGIRIRPVGEEWEVDLTDKAISSFLLKYLLPRFRALMEEAAG